MVRKRDLTRLSRKGSIDKHVGKGGTEQVLPNRQALSTLTRGDPIQRSMANYAKMTPMANPVMDGGGEGIDSD